MNATTYTPFRLIGTARRAEGMILTFTLTLFLLMSSVATGRSQGADADNTPAAKATPAPGYTLEIADGKLIHDGKEIEATLENVVDHLRERHSGTNIVIASGVPRSKVGSLKLRAASIEQELEAIRVASGEQFVWKRYIPDVGSTVVDPLTGLPLPSPQGPDEKGLYILEPARPETDRLRVETFNLTGYFESLRPDGGVPDKELIDQKILEIKRMVGETIEIYRHIQTEFQDPDPGHRAGYTTKFHRSANLLVVIGDPASVEIAAKVIQALPNVQRSGAPGAFDRYGGTISPPRQPVPPPQGRTPYYRRGAPGEKNR